MNQIENVETGSSNREQLCDFTEVVFQHGKYLRNFIAKKCWDKQDIDDVYQTALLEGFKSYGSFRGDSQIRTWLCGIALMVFRNKARKMNKVQICPLEDADGDYLSVIDTLEASEFDNPEKALEVDRMLHSIVTTTKNLPNSIEPVFTAVALDGMRYEEAATEFNIPIGTVRSRVSRARTLLRDKNSQFIAAAR
jgi:RNA polymerase sigma factor (sigma-70 family)